jgi:hypothetical protein
MDYEKLNLDNFNMSERYNFLLKYQEKKEEYNADFIENTLRIFENYEKVTDNWNELNKINGLSFNALKLFNITETVHSSLIAMLLNPNGEHGQKKLFLIPFLQMLGIEKPEVGNWIVTAEKGRIDILIKRMEPHSVIVIENKSNYAIDQENQLYRYWYQEIYYPNRHRPMNYTVEKSSNYQIVYLTPDDWKLPAENTLTRPNGYNTDLPNKIPITPKIIRFRHEIIEWLTNAYNCLPDLNYRLKEYVKQYLELWTKN